MIYIYPDTALVLLVILWAIAGNIQRRSNG